MPALLGWTVTAHRSAPVRKMRILLIGSKPSRRSTAQRTCQEGEDVVDGQRAAEAGDRPALQRLRGLRLGRRERGAVHKALGRVGDARPAVVHRLQLAVGQELHLLARLGHWEHMIRLHHLRAQPQTVRRRAGAPGARGTAASPVGAARDCQVKSCCPLSLHAKQVQPGPAKAGDGTMRTVTGRSVGDVVEVRLASSAEAVALGSEERLPACRAGRSDMERSSSLRGGGGAAASAPLAARPSRPLLSDCTATAPALLGRSAPLEALPSKLPLESALGSCDRLAAAICAAGASLP